MPFNTYRDLRVYQGAMDLCFKVFETTKHFPAEERFCLVDQIRRSSRSVCANLAEAWHKRRYPAAFVAKLSDSESEAAETQVWVDVARRCGYISVQEALQLHSSYDQVLAQLVRMAQNPGKWVLREQASSSAKPPSHVAADTRPPKTLLSQAPELSSSPALLNKGTPGR